jgi:hypothetical protein
MATDRASDRRDWTVLSAQGQVLFYIALCPGCTRSEIAEALGLGERAVWNVLDMLKRSGVVRMVRKGHTHHYIVDLSSELVLPGVGPVPTRDVLGRISEEARRNPNEVCRRIRRSAKTWNARSRASVVVTDDSLAAR